MSVQYVVQIIFTCWKESIRDTSHAGYLDLQLDVFSCKIIISKVMSSFFMSYSQIVVLQICVYSRFEIHCIHELIDETEI